MKSILVIAAHPDDEVLGCGGTLAKASAAGIRVNVAFLADGLSSRPAEPAALRRELDARRRAARAACEILGVGAPAFGEFPDNRMDGVALLDIVRAVEALVEAQRPDSVLTHHGGDLNVDHRRTHEAVATACRPRPGQTVRTILCFEVPSSTEWRLAGATAFVPSWYEDITATLERKLEALAAYADEMRAFPHPRSREAVEHLARWRGASVGVAAAEAFILGRRVA